MSRDVTALLATSPGLDDGTLRERLDRDGYLLLRCALPTHAPLAAHLAFTRAVVEAGWAEPDSRGALPPIGHPDRACESPEPEYLRTYHALYHEEVVHELAAHSELVRLAERLIGGPVLRHPRVVGRLQFPGTNERATPPHQDHLQVQGTPDTLTFWVPLHDIGHGGGLLAVSPGSHRYGLLDVRPAPGASGATVVNADDLTWAASTVQRGDVIVFHSLTVHRSLPNLTRRFRFSIDGRFQRRDAEVSERSLDFPPTSDLTWEGITEGWSRPELVTEWRTLALDLVPYDPSVNADRDRAAFAQAQAGDPATISALQRVVAHDLDPDKVATARTLLVALGGSVPARADL